jgi:hypothetical protein
VLAGYIPHLPAAVAAAPAAADATMPETVVTVLQQLSSVLSDADDEKMEDQMVASDV